MNSVEQKLLSTFIAQCMEMGETEWFFKPEVNFLHYMKRTEQQFPEAQEPLERTPRDDVGQTAYSTKTEEVCIFPEVSEETIATQEHLEDLYKAVCGCMRCDLGALRTNFVFGDGDPHADIMFIGEAPGKEEDAQGLPFVGRAGQLLTRMIHAIKLNREDVYIGNILKCRPPENRDPRHEEIEQCELILIRQIEIIRPKIICALGRIAGQTLLRTRSTLSALRGKVHDYHGVKLVVTYHPAALLRNQNWKPKAWEDLKFLRREYDGVELS